MAGGSEDQKKKGFLDKIATALGFGEEAEVTKAAEREEVRREAVNVFKRIGGNTDREAEKKRHAAAETYAKNAGVNTKQARHMLDEAMKQGTIDDLVGREGKNAAREEVRNAKPDILGKIDKGVKEAASAVKTGVKEAASAVKTGVKEAASAVKNNTVGRAQEWNKERKDAKAEERKGARNDAVGAFKDITGTDRDAEKKRQAAAETYAKNAGVNTKQARHMLDEAMKQGTIDDLVGREGKNAAREAARNAKPDIFDRIKNKLQGKDSKTVYPLPSSGATRENNKGPGL